MPQKRYIIKRRVVFMVMFLSSQKKVMRNACVCAYRIMSCWSDVFLLCVAIFPSPTVNVPTRLQEQLLLVQFTWAWACYTKRAREPTRPGNASWKLLISSRNARLKSTLNKQMRHLSLYDKNGFVISKNINILWFWLLYRNWRIPARYTRSESMDLSPDETISREKFSGWNLKLSYFQGLFG